jgi:N-acetyl sugar amidotransferase
MPLIGQVCSRGIWDESVPGIVFDENGESNYAKLFDRLTEAYPRSKEGKSEWEELVRKMKKNGKNKRYDCVIGVSGGTDSSYLLHLAIKEGLRPLAVNLDNGWNSDISVKNIKKMTTALNIDLETYVIDYEEIKDLLRSYMLAGLPWIDTPTDLAIKAILYKIASRESLKYILRGNDFRSEGSQPTEWTYGDGKQLSYVHNKFGRVKLKTFPNYTLFNLVYFGFVKGIKSIYPFYYLNYNKTETQKFLIKEYDWEYYGGHHHENLFTKFAISYWLFEKFGIDKRKITLSSQVLSREIERVEALARLVELPYSHPGIEKDIDYVLKKLDFTKEQFNELMTGPKRTYLDYPSYYPLIRRVQKFGEAYRFILPHKPMSFFQAEMRRKEKNG